MTILEPGHVYLADCYDAQMTIMTTFMKRVGQKYPGNTGAPHGGTNMQEILRMLIDRTKYLDRQESHEENKRNLERMREIIIDLEQRAARRHGRILEISSPETIEEDETCRTCGHIACRGAHLIHGGK